MSIHTLERVQRMAVEPGDAWAFFSDPRNLAQITPPTLGFELTSAIPAQMHEGMLITYRVRPLLRLPLAWVTEITHIDDGRLFIDEQRMGPYRLWHHEHWFTPIAGGVEMRDIVHYALPFGPLGDAVHSLLVRRQLRTIFDYRRTVLERRFGSLGTQQAASISGAARIPAR